MCHVTLHEAVIHFLMLVQITAAKNHVMVYKNGVPKWKICLVTVLCRSPKLITILQSVLEQLFSLITK